MVSLSSLLRAVNVTHMTSEGRDDPRPRKVPVYDIVMILDSTSSHIQFLNHYLLPVQIDARSDRTGEVVFKDNFNNAVAGIVQVNINNSIIACVFNQSDAALGGCYLWFYHMMSWKWNMDQSNVSVQVTCQVVVDWQRPAKSNYDLLLSSTSKFNWMHYLNDVKLF